MKISRINFIVFMAMVSLSFGCDNENPGPVKIPFEAELYTENGENRFKETCITPVSKRDMWRKDHQVGSGTATELGSFTTDLTFCFHIVLDENGNPDFENGFGKYKDGEGYMEAENGDRLFVIIPEGQVKPTDKEGYRFEFQDTMYVTGGTGQYKGALGEFVSDSYVGDGQTDHVWTGTLILPN